MDRHHATCPRCAAVVPIEPDYTPWCECGWNVAPERPPPASLLARLDEALGRARGAALFASLREGGEGSGRVRGLVVALAAAVLLAWAALGPAALALGVLAWPNPLGIVAALALLAGWIASRPRMPSLPEEVVADAEVPALRSLVDRVAREVGVPPPDRIALLPWFNAWIGRYGLVRARTVLSLGVPLLAVLTPAERVALVAHELAHLANGDARRYPLVGLAAITVDRWYGLLRPAELWPSRIGPLAIPELLANVVLALAAQVPYALGWGFVRLSFDDGQRAEYLAYRLGARVAGTEAFVAALDRALL